MFKYELMWIPKPHWLPLPNCRLEVVESRNFFAHKILDIVRAQQNISDIFQTDPQSMNARNVRFSIIEQTGGCLALQLRAIVRIELPVVPDGRVEPNPVPERLSVHPSVVAQLINGVQEGQETEHRKILATRLVYLFLKNFHRWIEYLFDPKKQPLGIESYGGSIKERAWERAV